MTIYHNSNMVYQHAINPNVINQNNVNSDHALSLVGICHQFDQKALLQDISFAIPQGQIACLVGASGVGKSTLFNIVAGLLTPSRGDVLSFGRCITSQTGHAGYMLQKDMLLPFKTVYDNIALPLHLKGMDKAVIRQKIHALLPQFGLDNLVHSYPKALSGGERQRASLLRTYLSHDRLMLLDEPFSALDYVTKHAMYAWFNNFRTQMGMSCLMISHDIDEALHLADTIYVLKGKPARICLSLTVAPNITDSPHYLALKQQILAAL